MHREDTATGGSEDEVVTAAGVVQFFWDSGDAERHLLVNIEPDDHHKPDAYELVDELRDAVIDEIEEGVRIEIDYLVVHHEVVDPDAATTVDSHRPKILEVRILDRRE
ncbi:MAG: hypothetical protein ACPGWS_02800 [Solirubrobacterales bacterium]